MKIIRASFIALVLGCSIGILPSSLNAESTRIQITGIINNTVNTSSTTFVTGRPFVIDFTLNLSASPTLIFTGTTWYDGAVTDLVFNYDSGAYIGTIDVMNVRQNYDTGTDSFYLGRVGNPVNASGFSLPSLNNGKFYLENDLFVFSSSSNILTSGDLVNPAGLSWETGQLFLQYGPDASNINQITDAVYGNLGTVSVVPEPSTYAALCGLSVLSFVLVRRKNKVRDIF